MYDEPVTVVDYGPQAWLVEVADPLGFAAAVHDALGDDVDEIVPAAATVLVTVASPADRAAIREALTSLRPARTDHAAEVAAVELPVLYDGEDLEDVAEATGMSVAEVVARHAAPTYRCAFCGFAPGFGYLTGLDPSLHLPRRATPRIRIPAGAVAIAAGYSAVYPSASPGGWHLIGHTDAPMWRTDRDPPALVVPGAEVHFVEVGR